jgi:hypothetical protein
VMSMVGLAMLASVSHGFVRRTAICGSMLRAAARSSPGQCVECGVEHLVGA